MDYRIPFVLVSVVALAACGKPRYDIKDQAPAQTAPTNQKVESPPMPAPGAPVVPEGPGGGLDCSAKGLTGVGAAHYGVDAYAKVFSPKEVKATSVKELFGPKRGKVLARGLRYADISVAPRDCTRGYPAPKEGRVLATKSGKIVSQYLGLSFQGYIAIDAETAGNYQFALLADDGALLEVFVNGQWQVLVDNDGFHSVRMKCSSNVVTLTGKALVPFRLYYYQGPRLHLANMLFWKKADVPPGNKVGDFQADEACGREGQRLFFSPKDSEPKAPFTEFLSRGWVTVPASSLIVPAKGHLKNPCFQTAVRK